jgi:hypothetical protein
MPAITTMLYPVPAYVRVEVNWADVGQATGAAVYRVDCLTGERVPLRPYVCFNGDFLTLSCGYGIFWDTEPQLDRCVYYCTQAIDAAGQLATAPAAALVSDSYTRVLAATWGSPDIGPSPYTNSGGAAGDYSVTGSRGQQSNPAISTAHRSTVDTGSSDQIAQITGYIGVLPTTGAVEGALQARFTDNNNQWRVDVSIASTGVVTGRLRQVIGGVVTNIQTTTLPALHVAGDGYTYWISTWGSQIQASVWKSTDVMPATPMFTTTDTAVPLGTQAGPLSFLSGAYTGTLPALITWDNFTVIDPCADLVPIETCTQDLVVPSSGDFRLGDPVRPCHDVTLLFEAPIDPDCVPTQGIFFGNMAEEGFTANTNTFVPVNAKYPIVVNRTRQAVQSTLTVASKTFPDRDALRTLNEPGSPLLLRGPAEYGINDRYMSVKDVTETRPLPDHRITPRVITLPHAQVLRPSGPSTGVCGTRVEDLCDIYPTWDALIAAGLTFADLVRGRASNETPIPDVVERTWAQVNTTYADWNAVDAGNTDWDDLRDGA